MKYWLGLLLLIQPGTPPDTLPPLSDLDRFPPAAVRNQAAQDSRRIDDWLDMLRVMRPYDQRVQAGLDAAAASWKPWEILCEAADSGNSLHRRRAYLGRLRELIGWEAYRLGRMPSPVPWWIFPERD